MLLLALQGWAQPFELRYSGRLTEASGKPIAGPVKLRLKFYDDESSTSALTPALPDIDNVPLASGSFSVPVALSPSQYNTLMSNVPELWIEVTDVTHGKTYPRQQFSAVPYALRVPIDDATIGYDNDGQLRIKTTNAPAADLVLKVTASGDLEWKSDLVGGIGSVSTGDILDGTIRAEDIENGTISDDKLATIATAGKVADTALSATVTKLGSDIDLGTAEATGSLPDSKLATISTAGKVADTALSANVTKLGSDINLADAETTGTLPVAKGGTGVSTLTGIVKANGTGAFTAASASDIPAQSHLAASDGAPAIALQVDADGKVGVGTASPSAALEVNGPDQLFKVYNNLSTISTNALAVIWADDPAFDKTSLNVRNDGTGNILTLQNGGGSNVVTVTGPGNVGIGTATPAYGLHISRGTPRIDLTDTDTGADSFVSAGSAQGSLYLSADYNNEVANSGIGFLIDGAEAVHINSSGNLGIGTITPTEKLHVVGNIKATGTLEAEGQWVYLGETELGANAATLAKSWTGNYKWLKIMYRLYGMNAGGTRVWLRFNNDATATYLWHHHHGSTADIGENGSGGTAVNQGRLTYLYSDTVNTAWTIGDALIANLQNQHKSLTSNSSSMNAFTAATQQQNMTVWRNTTDYITSLQLFLESGSNFKAGSAIKVWGMN
jgi:hypothetical protein